MPSVRRGDGGVLSTAATKQAEGGCNEQYYP